MADVTFTQEPTMLVLQHYPRMPGKMEPGINLVLSQLFRAFIARNVKPYISTVPIVDGIGIIERLQKVFAPTTHADFSRALQDLQDIQMRPGESISNFMRRFHTAHESMTDAAQTSNAVPTEFPQPLCSWTN